MEKSKRTVGSTDEVKPLDPKAFVDTGEGRLVNAKQSERELLDRVYTGLRQWVRDEKALGLLSEGHITPIEALANLIEAERAAEAGK